MGETITHSFPGIPDSRTGRTFLGIGILATSLVINSARRHTKPLESGQANSSNTGPETGELIEGTSFLEVGDNGIQFQGPDPRLSEAYAIPIFESSELQSTETG